MRRDIRRVLEGKLKGRFEREPGHGVAPESVDERRAEAVVAPVGVAHADDEQARRGRSLHPLTSRPISRPSLSSRTTSSGICPTAWVAQLRQGS